MPSLEYILRAAVRSMTHGHHAPHCYSGLDIGERAAREIEYADFATHYSEPGYDDPKRGIVFANWNVFPGELGSILERAGYSVEWSDEWCTCSDCGGAVRTSPDSYSWEQSYILGDGELLCHECVDWKAYCRSIEDRPNKAVGSNVDPTDYGYRRLSEAGGYECGFHPGQNDDPRAILAALKAQGKRHVLFRVSGVGQFDVAFETWIREPDADSDEPPAERVSGEYPPGMDLD